jgi:hypothetical protein
MSNALLLKPSVNESQSEPCSAGGPTTSEDQCWNNLELFSAHYGFSRRDSNEPRSLEKRSDYSQSFPEVRRGSGFDVGDGQLWMVPFLMCDGALHVVPSEERSFNSSGESKAVLAKVSRLTSAPETHNQHTTYPSPPADATRLADPEMLQVPEEDDTSPRYVLETIPQPSTAVPTINFSLAETYGEGDDFPALFAEDLANLRQNLAPLSPVPRLRTPESAISNFEALASPAFSTEGLPDSPITRFKQPFVPSQYWNNLDHIQPPPMRSSEFWSDQQIPQTAAQPIEQGHAWPSPMEEGCMMLPQQERMPATLRQQLSSRISINGPPASVEAVPFMTVFSPCTSKDMSREGFCMSHELHNLADCRYGAYDVMPGMVFPNGKKNRTMAQKSHQISFMDTRRCSVQEGGRWKDSKAAERDRENQLLVQWKREGMSYKDIKAKGRFKDAESTLRGRYRGLTKKKEERLRKPEWQDRDVGCFL